MDEPIEQQPGESLSEWAGRFVKVVNDFVDSFVAILKPALETILDIMKKFYDWVYSLYLEDGAPNGETPEGMQRWFEQKVRENQERLARENADKILWELPWGGFSPG